eukprot:TRINITY_DN12722_c0_g1_i1.p1 TRINITY_DN12722_c0_g1~~TRINITY_DN12722_c0_g1_i1.p1  ORF type:complete len:196 (+),score=38.28 TRINITY_DN12722_c0_g1_i1:83-670(+)
MCKSVRVYMAFITETEARTLEEYLNLFNRCVCMDAVLAMIYAISSAAIGSKLLQGDVDLVEKLMVILTVGVLLLFIIDLMLVLHLRGKVVKLAGQPEALDRIIKAKRLCVLNGTTALTLYTLRYGIELLQLYNLNLLNSQFFSVLFLAFILVVKAMRMLALNSFSKWARMFWVPGGAAGGVRGANRAPLQAQMAA